MALTRSRESQKWACSPEINQINSVAAQKTRYSAGDFYEVDRAVKQDPKIDVTP